MCDIHLTKKNQWYSVFRGTPPAEVAPGCVQREQLGGWPPQWQVNMYFNNPEIHITSYYILDASSTALGGGRSFKDRTQQEKRVDVMHGWQNQSIDGPRGGWSCVFFEVLDTRY